MAGGFALGTTVGGEPFSVDPRDLTTHGVIVGMTGSGKTGLGIVLLEEALSAGVPVLALDPKGDLGNLLLTFPDLVAGELPRRGSRSPKAREAGVSRRRARRPGGRTVAGGPRRVRDRAGADPGTARRRGADDLHTGLVRRSAAQPRRLAEGTAALVGDRGGDAAGRDRGHRHQPARARRDRGRPAREPRARPALEPRRARLARRPRPRPRHADRRDPDARRCASSASSTSTRSSRRRSAPSWRCA